MIAAVLGAVCGALIIGAFYQLRMLHERGGLAVLLAAVAFFYPVFAVQAGASILAIALHGAIFLGFCALAGFGYRRSSWILACGLIAHGLFDGVAVLTGHPGPIWWPVFCGVLDIVAGGLLLLLLNTRKIPQ